MLRAPWTSNDTAVRAELTEAARVAGVCGAWSNFANWPGHGASRSGVMYTRIMDMWLVYNGPRREPHGPCVRCTAANMPAVDGLTIEARRGRRQDVMCLCRTDLALAHVVRAMANPVPCTCGGRR